MNRYPQIRTRLVREMLIQTTKLLACLPLAITFFITAGCNSHPPKESAPLVSTPSKTSHSDSAFLDVTDESGIKFQWGHGGRSPLNIQETIGHGCTFLDYDQDGLLDVLLIGNKSVALYRNIDGKQFKDVSSESGLKIEGALCGVAVGDYDNDGYPDLFITGYGKCALYHNHSRTANPAFEDVTSQAGVGELGPYDFVSAAAFADLDGDGRLDLIAGRYISFTPSSIRLCTANGVQTGCNVKLYDPAKPRVYRNNGDGRFTDVTSNWGFDALHGRCLGIAVSSSGIGKGVTVYFANDEVPCDLMVKTGARYTNVGMPSGTAYNRDGMTQAGMGTDWGDYNNDGKPDLLVATFQGEPKSLYRSDSSTLFTEMSGPSGFGLGTFPYIAWTTKFLDYDNDGFLDIFVTNGHVQDNAAKVDASRSYAQPMQLYHNEGGARFKACGTEAGSAFDTPIVGRGASVGDFDNDGRLDLLIVNEEGHPLLLRNTAESDSHWLGVRLIGKLCNRDGIGARVIVSAGTQTVVRDQQLVGGYFSGQDPRLHFGLGKSSKIDRVEVRWPDGRLDILKGDDPRLRVDSYITVTEGEKP
jgi:hypothetical protein